MSRKMRKNDWVKHMKETTGLVPPSEGGDRASWQNAVATHAVLGCAACTARAKTKAKSARRSEREQVMKDLGLVKVRGACGGVYWE